jgi:hypothetical protein
MPFAQAMTFGQLLDRISQLMRKNLRLFMAIAISPAAAIFLLMAVAFIPILPAMLRPKAAPAPAFFFAFAAVYLVRPLIFSLFLAAASHAAVQADLGITITLRQAYQVAWRRFGRYLWLMILMMLYIIVPVLILATLVVLAIILMKLLESGANPAVAFLLIPLIVLLYLGILVYSVFIMLRFSVAYPASVAEDLTAWSSLKRSASLTSGGRWRILGLLAICYAVSYLANVACIAALCLIGGTGAFFAYLAHVTIGSVAFFVLIGLGALIAVVMFAVCVAFSYALYCAAIAVIYHDQRQRKQIAPSAPAIGAA